MNGRGAHHCNSPDMAYATPVFPIDLRLPPTLQSAFGWDVYALALPAVSREGRAGVGVAAAYPIFSFLPFFFSTFPWGPRSRAG